MAGGILGGLFGGSGDSSVMPGLLDQAGYMDPAEYDRRRQGDAMQGLWAGLLQGSGPSLEPRNFFSALGGGLAGSQKSANEFDEAQLRRAQGASAYQKSLLERQKLKLATDIYGEALPKSGSTGAPPGAPPAAPDAGGGGTGTGAPGSGAGQLSFSQVHQLALDAGFSPEKAPTMAAIVMAESGGNPGAVNRNDPGGSYGLSQINRKAHGDIALEALNNPARSLQIAFDLSKGGNNFDPWSTYKNGSYKKFLQTPGPLPNVADLSAVPDFAGAMIGQQGASYAPVTAPPMPGAVAAGAPGPAPAPGATVAPIETGTSGYLQPIGASQPARTGGYQFYGDSVAHGTRQAAGANGVTKVGWRPDQVLGSLTGANPQGDTVVISSGITNSTAADLPRDQWKRDIALVPQQIGAALKSGAGRVALYGVGEGVRDNGEINAALRQVAADNGAEFVPLIGTGAYTDRQGRAHAAGWHPSDYNAQNTYTRSQLGDEGAAPAPGATVGGGQPTAVPPVTSVPGPTNGIDPRRGAALEQILRGQQAAQAGPPLSQLARLAGPGAAGPVASAAIPPPLPEAPAEAAPQAAPGAAPAPGAITYSSGVLGRAVPAAAGAPGAGVPATVAPPPGGTLPGAATPGPPNTLFGMQLPVLPAAPPTPQVPAIPGLLSPGAPSALQPLAPVGAVPPVQLSPEQAARTQRAQRLSLALDLIGVTVPKFIADEAGIDVAARSAAAQEAAKQPFAVQMERLRGDIAQQRSEFEAKSKLQQDEYATKRGFATDQFKSALGQLDDIVKQYTAAGLAGPVAGAQERAKLDEQARLSPGIAMATAEGTARGTQLGKLNETIDDNARVARTNIADLKNMQTAAQGLAMRGIFADQTQFANQLMNALTGEQKDRVAAYEMVTKNSEKLVREQTRLSDNQPAAIQLVMTRNSMPTARTSEIGFDGVISQMLGAHEYGLYVQQEKVKWQATHPSLQGFEAQLPVSPYAFMVYRMPKNLEDQLMTRLAAGGPQGQREAQMLKDQISTLRNQGYGQ